jgi:hypothetical protein
MSFNEVMAELPKLTFEQRQMVMRRALELDEAGLSPEEERLIEARLEEYRRDPHSGVSLSEMEKRLRAKLGPWPGK